MAAREEAGEKGKDCEQRSGAESVAEDGELSPRKKCGKFETGEVMDAKVGFANDAVDPATSETHSNEQYNESKFSGPALEADCKMDGMGKGSVGTAAGPNVSADITTNDTIFATNLGKNNYFWCLADTSGCQDTTNVAVDSSDDDAPDGDAEFEAALQRMGLNAGEEPTACQLGDRFLLLAKYVHGNWQHGEPGDSEKLMIRCGVEGPTRGLCWEVVFALKEAGMHDALASYSTPGSAEHAGAGDAAATGGAAAPAVQGFSGRDGERGARDGRDGGSSSGMPTTITTRGTPRGPAASEPQKMSGKRAGQRQSSGAAGQPASRPAAPAGRFYPPPRGQLLKEEAVGGGQQQPPKPQQEERHEHPQQHGHQQPQQQRPQQHDDWQVQKRRGSRRAGGVGGPLPSACYEVTSTVGPHVGEKILQWATPDGLAFIKLLRSGQQGPPPEGWFEYRRRTKVHGVRWFVSLSKSQASPQRRPTGPRGQAAPFGHASFSPGGPQRAAPPPPAAIRPTPSKGAESPQGGLSGREGNPTCAAPTATVPGFAVRGKAMVQPDSNVGPPRISEAELHAFRDNMLALMAEQFQILVQQQQRAAGGGNDGSVGGGRRPAVTWAGALACPMVT